jgi:hypothetical protein
MPRRKHRAYGARRRRGWDMTRGALHPLDKPEPEVSRKCTAGRHGECGKCACGCHESGPVNGIAAGQT